MKILYLWVEDWGIFKDREFNFSDEYHFLFQHENGNGCLKCSRKDIYAPRLYYTENVELISYIIGDNGEGKTSLLNILMTILPYKGGISFASEESYSKVIYVLKEDESNGIYIYTTLKEIKLDAGKGIDIKNWGNYAALRMPVDKRNTFSCQEMKHTGIIFHSNILDRNRYNFGNMEASFPGVQDVSFNGLLRSDADYRTTDFEFNAKTELRAFFDADMVRQIKFMTENNDNGLDEWMPFPWPQMLLLHFKDESSILGSVYQYDNSKIDIEDEDKYYKYDEDIDFRKIEENKLDSLRKITAHIYKDVVARYNKLCADSPWNFRSALYRGILMSHLRMLFPEAVGIGTTRQFGELIFSLRNFMRKSNVGSCNEFVEKFIVVADIDSDRFKKAVVKMNDFAANTDQHGIGGRLYNFYICTRLNNKPNTEFITEFYRNYCITSFGAEYISFLWSGLSSGEYNMLSMYSRLYSVCEKMKGYNAIILIIDEADLSYHPRWQQNYLKSLLNFLNRFYAKKHIQIIIATHSPIMLSDAIKGNVIFLKGETTLGNTFGANIYDLYREGMFLETSELGIVGAYAAGKIKNVLKMLESGGKGEISDNLHEIENFIACIGEPIVRRVMQDKLSAVKQKIKENDKRDEDVALLINRLNELPPEKFNKVMEGIYKR